MINTRVKCRFIILCAIAAVTPLVKSQGLETSHPALPGADTSAPIKGAYKVALSLPKAKPTAILVFCSSGEPFTGAWVEDGGKKFMGEMYNQSITTTHIRSI